MRRCDKCEWWEWKMSGAALGRFPDMGSCLLYDLENQTRYGNAARYADNYCEHFKEKKCTT